MSSRFHNKFHRHNHHTDPSTDLRYPDSSHDPIASYDSPFLGAFVLSGSLICTSPLSSYSAYISNNDKALLLESTNIALSARGHTFLQGVTCESVEIAGSSYGINSNWQGGTDFFKLFANNSDFSEQAIAFQETGTNVGAKIGVKNTANGAYDIIFANRENTSTTSTMSEKMRITNDGNVGIGTPDPSYTLDVNGNAYFNKGRIGGYNHVTIRGYQTNANYGVLSFTTSGPLGTSDVNIASISGLITDHNVGSESGGLVFGTANVGVVAEKMRLEPSGNVGIGTTSPVDKLSVNGPIYIEGGTSQFNPWGVVDPINLTNTYFALGSAGSVNDWAYIRQIGGNNAYNLSIDMHDDGNSSGAGQSFSIRCIGSAASSPDPAPLTRFHINGIGNVGIGTATPSYQLELTADSAAKPSTSTWTVISDERVKENIRPYDKGLNALTAIAPVMYDYNGKAGIFTYKDNIGVVAQEVQGIIPECVSAYSAKLNETDETDTELLNFNPHALTFILINSIKELKTTIDTQSERISALELLVSGLV